MSSIAVFRTFLLFALLLLSSCSTLFHKKVIIPPPAAPSTAVDCNGSTDIKSGLLQQYHEWRNTPYLMGGLSKRGVDCSGFVYLTFRSKFGRILPRTTELQVKIGTEVERSNLRVGDLLFFRTGLFSKHVGISLGGKEFIHASSSRGVTLSSLNENYWSKHYWTARRICR